MKLFKLFALPLIALPSVALGMGQDTVTCDGKEYDLSGITLENHRLSIKAYVSANMLNQKSLDYILAPERVKKLIGFRDQMFLDGRQHSYAIFHQHDPVHFVFWSSAMPWYCFWAAVVIVGVVVCHRTLLAEVIKNTTLVLEKAQSLWAGIKSVFSR